MRSWSRRALLIVGGVLFAGGSLAVQGGRADAASYRVDSQKALTFVKDGGGAVTCTVFNSTVHNTDNASQPYVGVGSGLSGADNACFDFVLLTITVTYNDKSGVRRSARFGAFATGSVTIEGTYSPIKTTVTAEFFDCDSNQSASCLVTAEASPK